MICEKCNSNMSRVKRKSAQGWECPICGWNILTTDIDEIYRDMTIYSIYLDGEEEINKEKIKVVSRICNVNFTNAKLMLGEKEQCILNAKAPEIKEAIQGLKDVGINYSIVPCFKY